MEVETLCDLEHCQKLKYLRHRVAGAVVGQGGEQEQKDITGTGEGSEPRN